MFNYVCMMLLVFRYSWSFAGWIIYNVISDWQTTSQLAANLSTIRKRVKNLARFNWNVKLIYISSCLSMFANKSKPSFYILSFFIHKHIHHLLIIHKIPKTLIICSKKNISKLISPSSQHQFGFYDYRSYMAFRGSKNRQTVYAALIAVKFMHYK